MSYNYTKVPTVKRFVVEDSITKVTSDGQPHEVLTMVAGLSGLVTAFVILAILASLLVWKKPQNEHQCKKCGRQQDASGRSTSTSSEYNASSCASVSSASNRESSDSQRSSISTIYNEGRGQKATKPLAIFSVDSHLGKGSINSAFVGSELHLNDAVSKHKKRTHWSAEVEQQCRVKETTIDIERY